MAGSRTPKALTLRNLAALSLAGFLVVATGMLPRQVLPGQFYMVTRRCTQRQFLLRPDRELARLSPSLITSNLGRGSPGAPPAPTRSG